MLAAVSQQFRVLCVQQDLDSIKPQIFKRQIHSSTVLEVAEVSGMLQGEIRVREDCPYAAFGEVCLHQQGGCCKQ